MNDGFIKLHKKMTGWEWYKDQAVKGMFIHLLLIANYKDGRFKGRVIKRGQVVTSVNNLSRDLGMSRGTVQRCIKELKRTREIKTYPNSKYTLITIINYDSYQGSVLKNGTQPSTQHGTQPSTNRRNKEIKNSLKEREPINSPNFDEVKAYAEDRGASEDLALDFFEHYESNGWMVGKNPMKNWKASFNGWMRRHKKDDDPEKKEVTMNVL